MECLIIVIFVAFLLVGIPLKGSIIVTALQFEVLPAKLNSSGDSVTISWDGIKSPSHYNWIGVYNPPESSDEYFIGYIMLNESSAEWASGKGSFTLQLVNIRAPYEFRLFEGTTHASNKIKDFEGNILPSIEKRWAVSTKVEFANYNEPMHVHLALTSNADEMRVMFVTKDEIPSFVKYGQDKTQLHLTTDQATSLTYYVTDMCDHPANSSYWRDPGFIHNAVLKGLDSGKRYFYQVGSDEGGWSPTFSFVSHVPQNEETVGFLYGDLGTSFPYHTYQYVQPESTNTLKWLKRDFDAIGDVPIFVSHIGDISYARGLPWLWDEFFHNVQPIAANAPYHVCIGNHEYNWPQQPFQPEWSPYHHDGGGECGVPYSLQFQMPGNSSLATGTGAPDTRNLYYSMDIGVVHFLYYSTETDFLPGSEQYIFIANDLQSVDRKRTPFIVFLGHRPIYSSDHLAGVTAPVTQQLRAALEPLLVENKVNVALSGHIHKYERICSVQNYTCDETGKSPTHVVIGMAGAIHQPVDARMPNHPTYPWFPEPDWSLFRTFQWGYVRLHATRQKLTLQYVGNHDGLVHDVIEIPSPDSFQDATSEQQVSIFEDMSKSSSDGTKLSWWVSTLGLFAVFLVGLGIGAAVSGLAWRRLRAQWQQISPDETL
ncbi:unnamed protein product [Sphagnum compactum]